MKVLILGGYGTFGGRLAQLLMDEPRLELVIAGRSLAKAQAFARGLKGPARIGALAFDRDGDLPAQLAAAAPDLVVDATGPFQDYGERPYRLVEACIDAGIHYLDLADGADFVDGVATLDARATAAGVYALSGVSSFPVLTAAVTRALSHDMAEVRHVAAGIAPSPYAGVGLNVIRAIATYAGRSVGVIDRGSNRPAHALTDTRRFTIAPPGAVPLAPVRFSLVDTPDLKALPKLWPELQSVWMGAGPTPEILHRGLNALAWLVRLRLVPTIEPLAPLFHWAINHLRWGEHRGGMFVEVQGVRTDGAEVRRAWHMTAEAGDGPMIPSMAAEAIIRRALGGAPPGPGARAGVRDLELADYEALFARRAIRTGVRDTPDPAAPLYRRIFGEAWERLPEPIRALHDLEGELTVRGRAEIDRGKGPLAALAAALFGLPRAGRGVPVEVTFTARDGVEHWRRRFAGRTMTSTQEAGQGRFEGLLVERFGPVAVGLALVVDNDRLSLVVRRWSLFGLPLPKVLAPGGEACEHAEDGRFHFHVEIRAPLAGLIVRYRGWLAADALPGAAPIRA